MKKIIELINVLYWEDKSSTKQSLTVKPTEGNE